VLGGTVLLLAVVASPAAGQDEPHEPDAALAEESRRLFEAGTIAFRDGRFDDALQHFRRAHELTPHPDLLYNIASCLDRLRRDQEALEAFEAYIDQRPDASDREEIEGRIRELRRTLAVATPAPEQPSTAAAEPASASEPQAPTTSHAVEDTQPGPEESAGDYRWDAPRVGTWVALSVSGLAAAAAVGAWVHANSVYGDLQSTCGATGGCTDQEIADSGAPLAVDLTNVLSGTALVAGAAALALFFLEPLLSSESADVETALRVGPGALVLTGAFR
jgi:tetratricopeptide (TPR) repeat protein